MPASTAYSILLKKENAHEDPIYCCAWAKTATSGDPKAPTKDFIATGGLDGLVKVWLFENNRLELVHSLAGHSMAVVSVAVSFDGHTLASTSLDSTLIIWDLLSGHKVHEVQNSGTDIWKVAFSPEGHHIVTGSHTGKLGIYGIEKASLECVLDTRGKFVLSLAWSPDGKYIASGSTDGAACLFDAAQGKLLHTIQAHTQAVNTVTFSADSSLLLTASSDGTVHTYNVASGSLQSSMKLACRAASAAASSDGRAAAAAADGAVRVASLDKLQDLHVFKEHTGAVCGVQFNPEGNQLLSVSKDRSINIYECPPPPKSAAKK
ncbi:WD repeat-containing protein 61-like [Leguminivora glycinivorella]|uniref:WD repeat-containing protein 61-like n=1 Tax=Leguminivora glycinivorella TaxID=1035111 RepID=UPI002010B330|nr:WD repeat-containing protein 61-like [Leguminivora glycinivorella]